MTEHTIPSDAAQLPGVVEVYEAYHAALDARNADKTPETIAALNQAAADLNEARSYWREIRSFLRGEDATPMVSTGMSVPGPDAIVIEED